jgi:hypothetical protein
MSAIPDAVWNELCLLIAEYINPKYLSKFRTDSWRYLVDSVGTPEAILGLVRDINAETRHNLYQTAKHNVAKGNARVWH